MRAWHHLVWTDANGEGRLYVDGVLDETDYTYTRPVVTLDMTMIGVTARGTSTFDPAPVTPFTGNIDEVATWGRVLSWTEIQQVRTNGVPIPGNVVLAPFIAVQPQQRTNNVFVGDNVTFRVQVDGTPPFDLQWRKGGTPISGALNPSAITDTLNLTNVQFADSNTTYSVVVTNTSGSATSIVARLYVSPVTPVTNGVALNVDMGLNGALNPQPGFSEFTLGNNPGSFPNGIKVTISIIGINFLLSDRNRTAAPWVVNSPPDLTQAQIYNDFIFASDAGFVDGNGLAILIERLAPNTRFGLMIWSFDPVSAPERMSTWTDTTSGTPVAITNGVTMTNGIYTFNGATLPTRDFDYTFGGLMTSSPTGTLQIAGIRSGGTSFGVFVNALRLVANPTATRITKTELINGNLRLTVEGNYPGQPIFVRQSTDVSLPLTSWPDSGAAVIETHGPIMVFEVPANANQSFYRAVSYLP